MCNNIESCGLSFKLVSGARTKDGKPTYDVFCPRFIQGCKGPTDDEVQAFNAWKGRQHGASRRQEPFLIYEILGHPLRGWNQPRVIDRLKGQMDL